MLTVSKGALPEVLPGPAPPAAPVRAVLPMALAERVELPMKALPLVMPYSPSVSPSRSSALNACCAEEERRQRLIMECHEAQLCFWFLVLTRVAVHRIAICMT